MQRRPGFETQMTNWRIVEKVRADNTMTEIVWQRLMSVHVSLLRHQNHWKFMKVRTCRQHLKLCSSDLNSTKEWSCSATSWGSSLSIGWHILNWSSFTSFSSTVHWHVDYMENTAIQNGKIIKDSWLGVVSGLYTPANLIPFTDFNNSNPSKEAHLRAYGIIEMHGSALLVQVLRKQTLKRQLSQNGPWNLPSKMA